MAEKQDVGTGGSPPEDAIQDYLQSDVPPTNNGVEKPVDHRQAPVSVEEDISAPNIHYGSRLEGQNFPEARDTGRPLSGLASDSLENTGT